MFSAYCHHHDAEVLLTERRIVDLRTDAESVAVRFVCWCGTEGSFRDPRRSAAHLARAADDVLRRRQLA